jgi:hypothetical protein
VDVDDNNLDDSDDSDEEPMIDLDDDVADEHVPHYDVELESTDKKAFDKLIETINQYS